MLSSIFIWNISSGVFLITKGYKIDLIEVSVIALIIVFAGLMILKALESQRVKDVTGRESLSGKTGEVIADLKPKGLISIEGVRWRARSSDGSHIKAGEKVKVIKLDGLVIVVERIR